jgi:dUTP pyrophosphatase
MPEILFAALREGARIPQKRREDAGYDIYACFDEPYRILMPHQTSLIPSGIISAFPEDYAAILKERGSTGIRGFGQRAGVIDSGYRGEWMIALTNLNDRPLAIVKAAYDGDPVLEGLIHYPYEKAICQAVFVPLAVLSSRAASVEEILGIDYIRGTGRLGSSGK